MDLSFTWKSLEDHNVLNMYYVIWICILYIMDTQYIIWKAAFQSATASLILLMVETLPER